MSSWPAPGPGMIKVKECCLLWGMGQVEESESALISLHIKGMLPLDLLLSLGIEYFYKEQFVLS